MNEAQQTPDIQPGDLVRFKKPGETDTGQPVEDNYTFTVTSIKDGMAYWDEGFFPVSGLALVTRYGGAEVDS